ncbi:hypothetical protein Poli38472_013399 [Pythium oligandrum]|uniref:Elicitin n=1 Tax=Pythium oligandrum TaxID=41045 RepID=A0A8K1C7L9_PYTOL|nr:hypothetical protein Poli38472_013399 [Pythium oligandrum]|eukprot:TMW57925.1 hypothetical protein Poli38472_013399 [Pythium oligandrum]
MKTSAILGGVFSALASVGSTQTMSQCADVFVNLVKVADQAGCSEDSGFDLMVFNKPSAADIQSVCEIESCRKMVIDILTIGIPHCYLPWAPSVQFVNEFVVPTYMCTPTTPVKTRAPSPTPTVTPTPEPTTSTPAETKTPEPTSPETQTPETQAPETEVPVTSAPETKAPVTQSPGSTGPETKAPVTTAPETKAPEASSPAPVPSVEATSPPQKPTSPSLTPAHSLCV